MSKTAMQELLSDLYFKMDNVDPLYVRGLELAIETLSGYLPKERQQIIDAHIAGQKFTSDNDNPDSEEYYNQTFNK